MKKEENKGKISEDILKKTEEINNSLKEILKNSNASKEEIEAKVKELNEVFASFGAAQAQNQQAPQGDKKKKDDDVIDAEVL